MASPLEIRAQDVLRAWAHGLVTADAVVSWADSTITESDAPGALPDWLYSLSAKGPERCQDLPYSEFAFEWPASDFREDFLVALSKTDLRSRPDLEGFIRVAMQCMGEDLDAPEVRFGYQLDHLVCDCQDMEGALEYAREELPKFVPQARALRARLMAAAALGDGEGP
ncbi:MAG: hypothetical protein OEZ06_19490 [Myxococcales bacterium]|nr:hypothetical protein [Myxococcales bacterium]